MRNNLPVETTALSVSSGMRLAGEEKRGWWQRLGAAGRLLRRDRSGLLGFVMVLAVVLTALFAPVLAPHDPLAQALRFSKTPPVWQKGGNPEFVLGTDNLGRDIESRLIYGARVSVTVAFFGVLIAATLGMAIGLIAGYAGGRVDTVLTGTINLLLALPYLLFVVFIAAVLGRSLLNVILIFGITDAPIFARVTRGEVLRLKESAHVESAVSTGARQGRVLLRHILPLLLGTLVTLATFEMSGMIFYEAGLSFLGLSVPPNVPSWGNMLANGRQYLTNAPWIATFPGLAIMFASLGMNLLGDWLRDVMDPRMRRMKK
jgi:ABC-type dipeptide/oligopeptide/nickel transport system permease subunit